MILVGRYRSPFTRRVAISMQSARHRVRASAAHRVVEPGRRARGESGGPGTGAWYSTAGESLFDSSAILDYLDHLVGPQRALVPATRAGAASSAASDRVRAGRARESRRGAVRADNASARKDHQPWIEHNENQARSGLQLACIARAAGCAFRRRIYASRDHDDRDVRLHTTREPATDSGRRVSAPRRACRLLQRSFRRFGYATSWRLSTSRILRSKNQRLALALRRLRSGASAAERFASDSRHAEGLQPNCCVNQRENAA